MDDWLELELVHDALETFHAATRLHASYSMNKDDRATSEVADSLLRNAVAASFFLNVATLNEAF
ncbi:hypothetical protein E4U09_004811 [Claviceps aff. purpurea]|uniref:Uncharacterized protein n=1 Tax=Claviceps aff. purpurea TaxID=1967640 RepID=A0A9P7QCL8_9HYPO|nr:hypothetical protein E4U09_004811 [Claviceps aff. purpurea]